MYTDGACSGNPGPGGWAAIVTGPDGTAHWHAGHGGRTTNQRMEILAALRGLEHVPPGMQVTVFSDSQYVIKTMTAHWQRRVSQDLWEQLDAVAGDRRVTWAWVKGHAKDVLNNAADKLAVAAAADPTYGEQSGEFPPSALQAVAPALHAQLSHLDGQGRARMVDVSKKDVTDREATASGSIFMEPATLDLILGKEMPKGDVFTVAQVAGVMAAKKTSDLIPLCHPLPITQVTLDFQPNRDRSCVEISATVRTSAQTGVEMEALTAVSAAALTVFDMCKAVDRAMRIGDIRVVYKAGGKTGRFRQD